MSSAKATILKLEKLLTPSGVYSILRYGIGEAIFFGSSGFCVGAFPPS
jgi:hypothetical protein